MVEITTQKYVIDIHKRTFEDTVEGESAQVTIYLQALEGPELIYDYPFFGLRGHATHFSLPPILRTLPPEVMAHLKKFATVTAVLDGKSVVLNTAAIQPY